MDGFRLNNIFWLILQDMLTQPLLLRMYPIIGLMQYVLQVRFTTVLLLLLRKAKCVQGFDSLLADAASFSCLELGCHYSIVLARDEAAEDHQMVIQKGTSRCVVCSLSKDKIRTVYMCAKCKRALCPDEFFQYFHKNDVKVSPHFKICTSRE